jgi:hypothetical protein
VVVAVAAVRAVQVTGHEVVRVIRMWDRVVPTAGAVRVRARVLAAGV